MHIKHFEALCVTCTNHSLKLSYYTQTTVQKQDVLSLWVVIQTYFLIHPLFLRCLQSFCQDLLVVCFLHCHILVDRHILNILIYLSVPRIHILVTSQLSKCKLSPNIEKSLKPQRCDIIICYNHKLKEYMLTFLITRPQKE